jgi:hypothetical protein
MVTKTRRGDVDSGRKYTDKAPRGRKRRQLSAKQAGLKHGFRSGLEEAIAEQLESLGVAYEFEKLTVHYTVPESKHKYTPDFEILSNGIIVESKGRFLPDDRKKHLLIKKQHPNLDIRFVFSNPKQKISKVSQTTYSDWCNKWGFKWASKQIPEEWINETRNDTREP